MTRDRDEKQEAENDRLSDAYREAVGSVMAARALYDQARAAHGDDSWPARQAQDYLNREIRHRNELREQYDRVMNQRLKR